MPDSFSRYDIYAVAGSHYCYSDTGVLKNRFGLRDSEQLKKVEADISSVRQSDLLEHPIAGRFTVTHLCAIHRYLFGDIYPFAGRFRREDIMKGTTRFIAYQQINQKLRKLLEELHSENLLRNLRSEDFYQRAAYFFAELNYIHPFREGNGRATREFLRQLFLLSGYGVDWGAVPVKLFLHAMEESVYDTTELIDMLQKCLYKQVYENADVKS